MLVSEYLADSGYDSAYITAFDESGMMFVGLDEGNVSIDNSEIYAAIDRLINRRGYNVICKTENVVYYQRWSNKDNGRVFLFDKWLRTGRNFVGLFNLYRTIDRFKLVLLRRSFQ